jgi:hypothetical protein
MTPDTLDTLSWAVAGLLPLGVGLAALAWRAWERLDDLSAALDDREAELARELSLRAAAEARCRLLESLYGEARMGLDRLGGEIDRLRGGPR